jgi:hypothetical protein
MVRQARIIECSGAALWDRAGNARLAFMPNVGPIGIARGGPKPLRRSRIPGGGEFFAINP